MPESLFHFIFKLCNSKAIFHCTVRSKKNIKISINLCCLGTEKKKVLVRGGSITWDYVLLNCIYVISG